MQWKIGAVGEKYCDCRCLSITERSAIRWSLTFNLHKSQLFAAELDSRGFYFSTLKKTISCAVLNSSKVII